MTGHVFAKRYGTYTDLQALERQDRVRCTFSRMGATAKQIVIGSTGLGEKVNSISSLSAEEAWPRRKRGRVRPSLLVSASLTRTSVTRGLAWSICLHIL
jgi:hypothetical protein